MKKTTIFFFVLILLIILTACEDSKVTEVSAGEEEIVLRFAHVLSPDHPYQLGAEKFKEVLEENAPKSVRVEIYPGSELGSERDLTEGMQIGTIDIAIVPGTISSFEPKMGVFDLPYIFRDQEHAYKVLDGEIGEEVAADLPSQGLRLLSYWENGFRQVTNSSRPIETPDDLQGLKIRVPENSIYVDTFNEWNANVTTMAFGELYTALQQRTIDAQENPLALIYTNKFYEAQNYLSLTSHFYGPAHVLISDATWNKLSGEMQQAVQEAANSARDYERQLLSDADQEYLEKIEAAGTEINEVDTESFRESAKPVWERYESKFGDIIQRIQDIE
jgi:tripartite ATP-independent transporter DctP family solute receptor